MYRTRDKCFAVAAALAASVVAGCGGGGGYGGQEGQVPGPPPPAPTESPAPGAQGQMDPAAKAALQDQINKLLEQRPITFEPDKSRLTPESNDTLMRAAELMKKAPEQVRYGIMGFVAQAPRSPVNAAHLAQQRAQTVLDKLAQAGVPAERMQAKGQADAPPAGDPAKSRRVEIKAW